jgi:Pyruvate/2-oxoacid:ferredoxin oxidoreductase gamma subunit
MFQVRFHGRGGQGVVTAAEMLARWQCENPRSPGLGG